jgi:ActR/RegA family two-component response regulator
MGGIEFIRQAKRLRPDIRILVLTAYGDKDSAIEALRLGVTNYLEKPIQNLHALASAMELAMKP